MSGERPATERLRRSERDRVIAGVCGGLAEHLRVDATLVRVVFVVLAFFGGSGLILYLVLWLVMPPAGAPARIDAAQGRGRELVGLALIAIGALWLLGNLGFFRFVRWELVWPAVLIALGVALLVQRAR